MPERSKFSLYIRNFIFGVEDSLVSTVGLLSGIAIEQVPHATVLLTGVVYVFVEGFSMAVGSFLSEESAEEYTTRSKARSGIAILGASIMFVSFVIAGFVPILPYIILPDSIALTGSVCFSLLMLFVLGLANGKISGVKPVRRGLRMLILGGLAIGVGILVGKFFKIG